MNLTDRAMRRGTEDLIRDSHMMIALTRQTRTNTAVGGTMVASETEQDPKARFFSGVVADHRSFTRTEGDVLIGRYVLIGLPDDDIQEGDTFEIGIRKFRVTEVHPDTTYQVKAYCMEVS